MEKVIIITSFVVLRFNSIANILKYI